MHARWPFQIPAELATRIREVYQLDLERVASIGTRVDAALDEEFGDGVMLVEQEANDVEE